MSFAQSTAVIRQSEGIYVGEIHSGWDISGIANGGYMMTIAARAMAEEAEERELISITGYFTNPGRTGPVTIEVRPVKVGRGFSTFRAEVNVGDRPLLSVIGAYASPGRKISEARLVESTPLDLPPPKDCVLAIPSADGHFPPPLVNKIILMLHPEDVAAMAEPRSGPARIRGWFRLLEGEQPDPLALILVCDAFPPSVFATDLPIKWTPTLDLTVHIRNPHPSGWLKCQFRTKFITGGLLEEDGEIWDEEDNLVAHSRQLALVPR